MTIQAARSAYSAVMRGLDPRIHPLRKGLHSRWIAGSSPAMTICKFGDIT
ncbi:hypothetical protein ACVW1C_006867 [Bradyrhizobium sp. USDA 4011]